MAGSAFDALFSASAVPALMAAHGRTVVRWPAGNQGAAVTEQAIRSEAKPSRHRGDRDEQVTGETWQVQVNDTTLPLSRLALSDLWDSDGTLWKTDEIGQPSGGLVNVEVSRADRVETRRGGRRF